MVEAKFKDGRLILKGCFPHYRRPIHEIVELRRAIFIQLSDRHVKLPIEKKLHLSINCHKHVEQCDLSNIVQAVCQALDGKTLNKSEAILVDDSQVISLSARWIP